MLWKGGKESEKCSQVINNSIYRQLSANNEKFNKNIHTHMHDEEGEKEKCEEEAGGGERGEGGGLQ